MGNLAEYWKEIRELTDSLRSQFPDGKVYITALTDKRRLVTGGAVCVALPNVAAKMILDGMSKISDAGEIEAYHARMNLEARRTQAAEQRLRGDRRYRVEL